MSNKHQLPFAGEQIEDPSKDQATALSALELPRRSQFQVAKGSVKNRIYIFIADRIDWVRASRIEQYVVNRKTHKL